jgi:hypothetical protein
MEATTYTSKHGFLINTEVLSREIFAGPHTYPLSKNVFTKTKTKIRLNCDKLILQRPILVAFGRCIAHNLPMAIDPTSPSFPSTWRPALFSH